MKKNLILFVFVVLLMQGLSAQDGTSSYIPPSPEAASLHKFTEVPVSYHTGVPNIGIPLYEINVGSLSLPISLSYHAGGVKVEEIASSVGMGWALNAGGLISRTIRDLPDDMLHSACGGKSVYGMAYLTGYSTVLKTGEELFRPSDDDFEQIEKVSNAYDEQYDGTPDLFHYNFAGYSGKWVVDYSENEGYNPTILGLPGTDLKIKPITRADFGETTQSHLILGWEIKTPDGTIYRFKENMDDNEEDIVDYSIMTTHRAELTDHWTDCNNYISKNISSWHLTKIISADKKDEIVFNYVAKKTLQDIKPTAIYTTYAPTEPIFHKPNSLVAETIISAGSLLDFWVSEESLNFIQDELTENGIYSEEKYFDIFEYAHDFAKYFEGLLGLEKSSYMHFSGSESYPQGFQESPRRKLGIEGYRLESIDWYKSGVQIGEIEFVHDQSMRLDLDGGHKLDKIVVNSIENGNKNEVKSFILNHFYNSQRLYLESITECNISYNKIKKPYEFEYYNLNENVQYSLPYNRLSSNQDFWGYSNGQDNDAIRTFGNMIPTFYDAFNHRIIEGADRTPNFEYAVTGTLKQITYPTGGTSNFEYELNEIKADTTKVPKSIVEVNRSDVFYTHQGANELDEIFEIDASCVNIPLYGTFVDLRIDFEGDCSDCPECTNASCPEPWGHIYIDKLDDDNEPIERVYSCYASPFEDMCGEGYKDDDLAIYKLHEWLENGKYRLHVASELDIYWSIKWKTEVDPGETQKVGGLRIKKITADPVQGERMVRRFEYSDDQGESSGKIPMSISFEGYYKTVGSRGCALEGFGKYPGITVPFSPLVVYEIDEFPNGGLTGPFNKKIGYSCVIEYKAEAGEVGNGNIEYRFSNFSDNCKLGWYPFYMNEQSTETLQCEENKTVRIKYPFAPADAETWTVGVPLETIFYDSNGQKVKTVKPSYESVGTKKAHGITVGHNEVLNCQGTTFLVSQEYYISPFYISTGYNHKLGEIVSMFESGSEDPYFTQATRYEYNEEQNYVDIPAKQLSQKSNGGTIITHTKYPKDYEGLSIDWINSLLENNIIVPIEQVSYQVNVHIEDLEDIPDANIENAGLKILSGTVNKYTVEGKLIQKWNLEIGEPLSSYSYLQIGASSLTMDEHYSEDPDVVLEYDLNGNVTQVQKKDDMAIAYLWGYNNTLPIAKVSNANHTNVTSTICEIFNENFDEGGKNNWVCSSGSPVEDFIVPDPQIPDIKTLQIEGGSQTSFSYTIEAAKLQNKKYIFTANVKANAIDGLNAGIKFGQNGPNQSINQLVQDPEINKWYTVKLGVDLNTGITDVELVLSNALAAIVPFGTSKVFFKDIRFYPANAQMTTYTYSPLIGMSSQTNVQGVTTFYEYDGLGRLNYLKDNDSNIRKKYHYHYDGITLPADFTYDYVYTQSDKMIRLTPNYANPLYTYHWDFGDGNTSSDITPTHDFTAFDGLRPVTLTYIAPDGESGSITKDIYVLPLISNGTLDVADNNTCIISADCNMVDDTHDYSYQWSVEANSSDCYSIDADESNKFYIYLNCNDEYDFNINCKVTDNVTGASKDFEAQYIETKSCYNP